MLKSTSSTEAEPAAAPPAAACTLIPNKGTIRHSLFYSLGGLLGDLTQPAQPGTRSPECRSVPLSIEQNSAVCWLAAAGYF